MTSTHVRTPTQLTNPPASLRITLPDVARLAKVQRPVVSMWRSRSAETDTPFPAAVSAAGGQESFALTDVVEWLAQTGRGKNAHFALDAPAFATLDGARSRSDEAVFAGLTALFCLISVSGRRLTGCSAGEILDLADDSDPDDEFLYSELEVLGAELVALAEYADKLCDGAYSPVGAFEQLMGERFRLHITGQTQVALVEPARNLVATLAFALGQATAGAACTFVDPTAGGSDLLVDLAALSADQSAITVAAAPAPGPAARLARRRLAVHDIHHVSLTGTERDGYELPAATLAVAAYPSPGNPQMDDAAILDAIENLVLQMDSDHYGVVIAPAAVLTEATARVSQRTQILRTGRVRAMVRLGAGLVTVRPRERLALWVLGPVPTGTPADEIRTAVADLANVDLTHAVRDTLVTDLLSHLSPRIPGVEHHPHFTRLVFNWRLLSKKAELFDPVSTLSLGVGRTAAQLQLLATELASEVAAPSSPQTLLEPSALVAREDDVDLDTFAETTFGAAISSRAVRIFPGHRIDAHHLSVDPGNRVIGVAELLAEAGDGDAGQRSIDRLVLANYAAAQYTEPGDVVFCTAPRPAAMVDAVGNSVVLYPARIVRISPGALLLPQVLAADISRTAPGGTYKNWKIRQLPRDQLQPLASVLTSIELARSELAHKIKQLNELTAVLIEGISTGLTTMNSNQSKEGL